MSTYVKSRNGKMNVNYVTRHSLCTGCGTCVGVCPSDAIEMKKKSGIYLPEIENAKCNNCGTCYRLCPGHSISIKRISEKLFINSEQEDFYMGRYLECYTGFSSDFNIRYRSASGGVVTQLILFMLENKIIDGAVVTRMQKK